MPNSVRKPWTELAIKGCKGGQERPRNQETAHNQENNQEKWVIPGVAHK